MSESEKDLVREIWEHRDDPKEWGEEEEIEVRSRRSSVLSFRLPSEEFAALEQAMEQTGESLSEFIRKALAIRLHGIPIGPALEVTYGGPDELLVRRQHGDAVNEHIGTAASYIPKRSQGDPLNLRAS